MQKFFCFSLCSLPTCSYCTALVRETGLISLNATNRIVIRIRYVEITTIGGDTGWRIERCGSADAVGAASSPRPGQCGGLAGGDDHLADGVVVTIRNVEIGAVAGDAGWIIERCGGASAVGAASSPRPGQRGGLTGGDDYLADGVVVTIRNVEIGTVCRDAAWKTEQSGRTSAVGAVSIARTPRPGQRGGLAGSDDHPADAVVVLIRHIEIGAVGGDAEWVIELCGSPGIVGAIGIAGNRPSQRSGLASGDDHLADAVVSHISHIEIRAIAGDAGWIAERRRSAGTVGAVGIAVSPPGQSGGVAGGDDHLSNVFAARIRYVEIRTVAGDAGWTIERRGSAYAIGIAGTPRPRKRRYGTCEIKRHSLDCPPH